MPLPVKSTRKPRLRAYCPHCNHKQIFVRVRINHWGHFFLTVITAGLWAISWISVYIGSILRPWRCEHCGWHRPQKESEFPPQAQIPGLKPHGKV